MTMNDEGLYPAEAERECETCGHDARLFKVIQKKDANGLVVEEHLECQHCGTWEEI